MFKTNPGLPNLLFTSSSAPIKVLDVEFKWYISFQMTFLSSLFGLFEINKVHANGNCHSLDCSTIIRRVAIWSVQDLSFLKPSCLHRSCLSMASLSLSKTMQQNTLLGIEKNDFAPSPRSPFLGELHQIFMLPLCSKYLCFPDFNKK